MQYFEVAVKPITSKIMKLRSDDKGGITKLDIRFMGEYLLI